MVIAGSVTAGEAGDYTGTPATIEGEATTSKGQQNESSFSSNWTFTEAEAWRRGILHSQQRAVQSAIRLSFTMLWKLRALSRSSTVLAPCDSCLLRSHLIREMCQN